MTGVSAVATACADAAALLCSRDAYAEVFVEDGLPVLTQVSLRLHEAPPR